MAYIATRRSLINADVCEKHRNYKVLYVCETCSKNICSACLTKEHSGHLVKYLNGDRYYSREDILQFVNHQEYAKLPNLKKKIKMVDKTIRDNERKFQSTAKSIERQGERLKYEISVMTRSLVSVCETIMVENDKLLEKYRNELNSQVVDVQKAIQHCKDFLIDGKTSVDLQNIKEVADTNGASLKLARFDCCSNTDRLLKKAFGELTIKSYGHGATSSGSEIDSLSTKSVLSSVHSTGAPSVHSADDDDDDPYVTLRVEKGPSGPRLTYINNECSSRSSSSSSSKDGDDVTEEEKDEEKEKREETTERDKCRSSNDGEEKWKYRKRNARSTSKSYGDADESSRDCPIYEKPKTKSKEHRTIILPNEEDSSYYGTIV